MKYFNDKIFDRGDKPYKLEQKSFSKAESKKS